MNIAISSGVIFFTIFHSILIFRNIRENLFKSQRAFELLLTFNAIKEDIMKSSYVYTEKEKVVIVGFLLSLSDKENERDWGIVSNCKDNIATLYNIVPGKSLWILEDDKTLYRVTIFHKRKVATGVYEVILDTCPKINSLCFSNLYEVYWYSEGNKIYRETIRNDGVKVSKSKFFVSGGRIEIHGEKVIIKNGDFEISFNL